VKIKRLNGWKTPFNNSGTNRFPRPTFRGKFYKLKKKGCLIFFPSTFVSIFSWGIWFDGSKNKMVLVKQVSEDFHFEIESPLQKPPVPVVSLNSVHPRKFNPVPKPTKILFRNNFQKNQRIKSIQLTKEEKEAYDQLMLALAITGSKLREVKDKVNGLVEPTASIKTLK
jgi:hypothetical protein